MPPVGFEPTTPEGERQQTYALDHAASGIGYFCKIYGQNSSSITHLQ